MKSSIQNLISFALKQSKSASYMSRCDSDQVINMLLLNCSPECEIRLGAVFLMSRQFYGVQQTAFAVIQQLFIYENTTAPCLL